MKKIMVGMVVFIMLSLVACGNWPYREGSVRLVNASDSTLNSLVIRSEPLSALARQYKTTSVSPGQELVFKYSSSEVSLDGEIVVEFFIDGTGQTINFGYITPGMAGGDFVVRVLGLDVYTVDDIEP